VSISELNEAVINWYQHRYPNFDNNPNQQSLNAINDLCLNLLLPIQNQFGEISITYGFTSQNLLKQIKKLSPQHIAPNLDQHAANELNTKGKLICDRGGAACDIFIAGFENNMYEIAKWAADNLPFDRMYLYGNERPIHLSYGSDHSRFIQVMNTNEAGRRFPGKRGTNNEFTAIIGEVNEP
jgi:hypothetical protein